MRHAKDPDLDRLEDLLVGLRAIEALRERTRGNFSLRSRAFLHFHADGDDLYADVRLNGATFERYAVTTEKDQRRLLAAIADAVAPARR